MDFETFTTGDARSQQLRDRMSVERLRTLTGLDERTMPTFDHELFGKVWAPQSALDLTALISHLGWQVQGGWRGQSNIDWYLDSTAVRRIDEPRPEDDLLGAEADALDMLVCDYEDNLLNRARLAGFGRTADRDLHDLELLGLLRHHGAATRLMDFTRNMWVALWFACRDGPDRFGLLVGLNLRQAFEVRDQATLVKPYAQLLRETGDKLALWNPSALSPRMPAQQGFFLWGRARFRKWGSIGEDLVNIDQLRLVDAPASTGRDVPGLVCVAIAPELKSALDLQWRSVFGYDDESMFPDLPGFAEANRASKPLVFLHDDDEEPDEWDMPSDDEEEEDDVERDE